jgi:hypothetical protein
MNPCGYCAEFSCGTGALKSETLFVSVLAAGALDAERFTVSNRGDKRR